MSDMSMTRPGPSPASPQAGNSPQDPAQLPGAAEESLALDKTVASWKEDFNSKPHNFEPRIVAFVCNWCTYTGADLAGTSRLKMAPNVRVLRLPCSSRVSPLFLIKAFQRGADGVIVSGCHPGDCHYSTGNYYTRRRLAILHDLLDFIGVDVRRVTFSWVSASEGGRWQEVVDETTARVKELGPLHRNSTGRVGTGHAGTA